MKKATTHLRSAVPLEWRYRAEAVRSMRTPEGLWLPLKVVERRWAEDRYRSRLGREPELDAPRTFTEKILWRILYDRRQIWRTLRDKYRVRDFVRSRVGDQFLVPLLYVSRSPSNIPFDRLDDPYVVKPTHMSGVIYRCGPGQGSGPGRRRRIAEDLYWHLHNSSGFPYGVWPWYDVDPRIVIE